MIGQVQHTSHKTSSGLSGRWWMCSRMWSGSCASWGGSGSTCETTARAWWFSWWSSSHFKSEILSRDFFSGLCIILRHRCVQIVVWTRISLLDLLHHVIGNMQTSLTRLGIFLFWHISIIPQEFGYKHHFCIWFTNMEPRFSVHQEATRIRARLSPSLLE